VVLDSSVSIVTGYGAECLRIKSRWGVTIPFTVQTDPVVYRFLNQGKRKKAWCRTATASTARIKKE
jgi:hypothetical protein